VSFRLEDVGLAYGEHAVLSGVTARFEASQMSAIAGPNGAGKSTLLSIMAGLRDHYHGTCSYAGRALRKWPRRAFARSVAFVPQSLRLEFPFTAGQVVMMGRTPFGTGLFEAPGDREEVERAMAITDTLPFRERDFRSLSGGERQRVIVASALAQSPEFLLLDEPTTFLDLKHQIATYRLLRELCRAGLGVVTVTHDLNLALTYADRVMLLAGGRVVADGDPRSVITPGNVHRIFDVHAAVHETGTDSRWIAYEP
jgi:ABC-type cobalamin/Fe3+-siderophores transport system ATPase subunit